MIAMENTLPIPPTLFAEIVLLFDHDFPIEQVDALVGVKPTESKRRSQTHINPTTKKNNPGFWAFQTKSISSFDTKPLLLVVDHFLSTYSSGLHQVIKQFSPSGFILRIQVLVQQEEEYPAIRFNPEILQLLSSFNASIDIVIENELVLRSDGSSGNN